MEVPWKGALSVSLSLLLCFTTSLADQACKSSCSGVGGPFIEGNLYKYELKGNTKTYLAGSSNDVASLEISATAEVFAESKCQHVLKLSNVEVKGPEGKSYNGLSAECAKPIKFSYNDGKLAELCGEANDKGPALNIKRAVISLLSSLKKKDGGSDQAYENDVFGICPTNFDFSKQGSKLTIYKTRNLNRCALREDFNFPFPTTPYQAVQSSFGAFETSPLLGAELTVEQVLDNGVLQKASGSEVYTYHPLTTPEAGATVKVSYSLVLKGSGPGSIPAAVNSHKSLYYETPTINGDNKNEGISAALQKALAALEPVATPEAAKYFANLVYAIEHGNKASILEAYSHAGEKTAKKLFLDGLLYAGSAESIEAAAELLKTKQIPDDTASRWYLDLNFVKHVTPASLNALVPLLSGDHVPNQAYLGIGAVAGKFCLQNRQQCESSPELKTLLLKLSAPLAGGCKVPSHQKENNVIASLKGLRNARYLTDEVGKLVSQCASDKTAKTRVRVAAVEAFHADPAKPFIKDAAKQILKDVEEDSELRIKAYLALVECPCPKVADIIKNLIDNEPVNQVGSFIVSHLRNLKASVNPEKEAAKQFFGNIVSKKRYPFDQRKFSRNYEVSYSLDAINVGTVGEVNRIFSQKSFIPRSVSLNLTTQLFGQSVNLAEVGLRAEHLEWHLEKYFGPKGFFKSDIFSEFLDEAEGKAEEALRKAKEKVEAHRPKRSISKEQALAAADKIELGPDYENRDTNLDLSVKLFGSDVAWFNYHHDKFDYRGLKRQIQGHLDESLDKSKSIDIDYKKARQFLDVGVTYPTGLGFGLKVKVQGDSAVNIKVNGQLDVKAIVNNPKNAHVAFQVVPSASVELASVISVDADVVESGVKVSASLHTSTGSDLTVKVLDGYGVDVKLGLPVQKQEILNFHSDIVSIVRESKGSEVESPIKFNVKRQERGGCFDQLSPLTGLTFCGEVSIPMEGLKILSPAYGPSKASLRLEKDDESLTAYHFRAFYNNKEPNKISLDVLLDTPNSKTSRKFALNVHGSTKPQKQILVTLNSPFKQASFEGLVTDTESEHSVSAKLISDGSEYSFKVGAHVSGDANRKKYEPLIEYKYPEATKSDRAWIGRKGAAKGGHKQQTGLGITGAVFVEKSPDSPHRKYELKAVTLTTPRLKLTVDGSIVLDDNVIATDLKATYDKDSFTFNSKFQKLEGNKYIAKVELLPSQYPDFGLSIKWEYSRVTGQIEHKLVVVHGPDHNSESARLSLSQLAKYKYETVKSFDFYTENAVTYPLLDLSAKVNGGATQKSAKYEIDFKYDKTEVKSTLDAKTGAKHPTDYSIDFEAKALGNSIDFSSRHDRVTATKSKFTNSLELKPGGKYQLNAIWDLNMKPGDVHQSLDAQLTIPQDPKTVKVKSEVKYNSKVTEIELELIAANKHLFEFEYERQKKADPSGKFKLSIPKCLESEGSFEKKGDKLTGSFHVDSLITGRKIEGNCDLTVNEKHLKGSGNLLWDAKKDPSKKIHLETDTEISGKSINSKNALQVLDYKTEANVKGNIEGSLTDGTLIGEAEVVLPSGRIVAAKVNRLVHLGTQDNKIEGTWELHEYASKGAQPRKLILKINGKNINPAKVQFDGQVDLTYVTPNKEDAVLHVVGKQIPQGDKWSVSVQGSVTGSLIKHPVHSKLNAEVSELVLRGELTADRKFPPCHYDFELKAGNYIAVNSNGKINQDQLNHEIELKLPNDSPVNSLKWQTTNVLNIFGPEGSEQKVLSSNVVHWNGDKFVKFSVEDTESEDQCHGKITLESHELSPRVFTYKIYANDEADKAEGAFALQWDGKTADVSIKVDGGSDPVFLSIISNIPDKGRYELELISKEENVGVPGEIILNVKAGDQKLVFSVLYSNRGTAPLIDMNLELPQGKSRFYLKVEKKSHNHGLIESKVNWFTHGGGSIDLGGEINVKSLDDLLIKLNIDSPKLNLNKVIFEAKSAHTKSAAKSISFHGKSAEKEISGSLNLVSKGTSPNYDYEGNGVLKVGETSYPVQFKFKGEVENGKQKKMDFKLKAGDYSYESNVLVDGDAENTFKLDSVAKYCKPGGCKDEEFKIDFVKKGPFHLEMEFKTKLDILTHILLEHPLIIHHKRSIEGWKQDYLFEVEYGPEKIQYHGYIKDDQAGLVLALPKRVIATEVVYNLYKNSKPNFKIEGSFWLDKKNNPNDRTRLLLTSQFSQSPDGLTSAGEASFSTPGCKELSLKSDLRVGFKDRLINAKLEADVFAKKNQKIVVEYKANGKKDKDSYSYNDRLDISSKGLSIDAQLERKVSFSKTVVSYIVTGYYVDSKQAKRESIVKFVFDPPNKSTVFLVKIPEGTIVSIDIKYTIKDKRYSGTGKYELLGYKYEEHGEGTSSRVKGTCIVKADNNPQLDYDIRLELGQVAEVNLKFNKKPLLSVEVALDEAHFLKSKHSYDTDNAKELVKFYKDHYIALAREASRIVKETGAKLANEVTDKADDVRKALPNFKPAIQHYHKELEQLREEFKSNENVKDAIEFLKKNFGIAFSQVSTILEEIANTSERLLTLLNEATASIIKAVKATIPELKEAYEKASESFIDVAEDILDYATTVINNVLDKIKENRKDFDELIETVANLVSDVAGVFAQAIFDIQRQIKDFVYVLYDQIQTLPAYTMAKEKLQELKNYKIPEQYWETYHEVVDSVLKALPTPELQVLVKTVAEVFEKLVKQEPFNKQEAVHELYQEFTAAVRSIIVILEAHQPDNKGVVVPPTFLWPVPSLSLFVAPPGTFRLSLLNWIKSPDLPTLTDIFHTYRPKHSPLDFIPPFYESAQLIGGTEFFTFDKKHFSFKGSCSYILTTDAIDGNFTVVANMEAGKLKSIAVFDRENSLELLNDNTVLFNGKPADLPVHEGELNMWSLYDSGTGFATWSEFMFFCTPHLKSCAFTVNGFYFGKTRGLLGTYNYEPYDDNTVPQGKVAKTTAEFANSWKVNPQCPDGAVHEQPAPAQEECTKLFSGDSSLRECFGFENPNRFREACNKQVSEASGEAKQDRACNIALSYVGYCYYVHFVPIDIPDYCGKCQVGSQTLQIGESTQIKTPQKEADVVFVVEQLEENEEVFNNLITPLVSTLTNDLKEKGITDVKFALIGYGAPSQNWPDVYTFNGKYNEFPGTAKNIKFEKASESETASLSDKLKELKKKIDLELGNSKAGKAYRKAFDYPFRPEAMKTIVAVASSPCDETFSPFWTVRALVHAANLRRSGIVMNLITPLEDLEIKGKDEKTAANIVGFDSTSVYTQSEAKRKVLKGDEEAFKNLMLHFDDPCIHLTLGIKGAVFSSSNFINGKPNLRKNFIQVLSNKITQSLTSDELEKECKCELERGMVVRTKCKIISRKEKEALVKGGVKGGVKG